MSSTPIHDMVCAHAVRQDQENTARYIARHQDKPPKLHCSGMDKCVRAAYLAAFQHAEGHPLQRPVSHPFSTYLLRLFEMGRMYEDQLSLELVTGLEEHVTIEREPSLGVGAWSGRPDFVIGRCEQFPEGAIIDCKATGSYQFAYTKSRIPRLGDCLQVLAYQHFMSFEDKDFHPEAYLYYRQWYNYGEFQVWQRHGTIYYEGSINGHEVSGEHGTCLKEKMDRLEMWWPGANADDYLGKMANPVYCLPGYSDPFESTFGCLRESRGKWWSCCRWLSECWPQFEPGNEGPFVKPYELEDEDVF